MSSPVSVMREEERERLEDGDGNLEAECCRCRSGGRRLPLAGGGEVFVSDGWVRGVLLVSGKPI